jgi:glutamyl-tRNA synthetase
MQRMDRYKAVLADLQTAGHVTLLHEHDWTHCAKRRCQTKKPRYDGWRPAPGKALPAIPRACSRYCGKIRRVAVWCGTTRKGRIEISNDELDDLVIARPDAFTTLLCVVVDDIDGDHPCDSR